MKAKVRRHRLEVGLVELVARHDTVAVADADVDEGFGQLVDVGKGLVDIAVVVFVVVNAVLGRHSLHPLFLGHSVHPLVVISALSAVTDRFAVEAQFG